MDFFCGPNQLIIEKRPKEGYESTENETKTLQIRLLYIPKRIFISGLDQLAHAKIIGK
jgi:hypothetical protein